MSSRIRVHLIAIFPEQIKEFLSHSILKRAQEKGHLEVCFYPLRDFTQDKHRRVDDTPYGGGSGMLLRADVLYRAWERARESCIGQTEGSHTVLLSPQGRVLTQDISRRLSGFRDLILVCGHYEGLDERFIELCVDEEISIGNYVLSGGELAAAVIVDSFTRLIPGVLGNEESVRTDSLESGLLKYPQYTRPKEFMGLEVPPLLTSGNHQKIAEWRLQESEKRTYQKRADLIANQKSRVAPDS